MPFIVHGGDFIAGTLTRVATIKPRPPPTFTTEPGLVRIFIIGFFSERVEPGRSVSRLSIMELLHSLVFHAAGAFLPTHDFTQDDFVE